MRLFPSERARQESDRRTVVFFFKAMAILTVTVMVLVTVHRLLGWW
jgi:hypothetical protein